MKEKIINIFITHTEYHLINAIHLALMEFNSEGTENQIYYTRGERRLSFEVAEIQELKGFIQAVENEDWLDFVRSTANVKCNRFFIFQENSITNRYMGYKLRNKGARVCLGPDGAKPYATFNKNHEIASMIKDTITDYRFLFKHKLFLPAIMASRYYRYGSSSIIDEVWLQYPELFNAKKNKTKAMLMKIPEFTSHTLDKVVKAFHFEGEKNIASKNVILYINQPFWSDELINIEFELLDQLSKKYPDNIIYNKLHPNTPFATIERYKNLSNMVLINDNKPAELYISYISNSMIVSGWSSALMHYNSSNTYYYLYKFYMKSDDKVLRQMSLIPFKHIGVVADIEQIKFDANRQS